MYNVSDVKILAGIKTDEHDDFIETYCAVCFDWIKAYCNNEFTKGVPKAVELFMAKALNLNMTPVHLKARSMGTVSYTYNTEYPESVLSLLTPYRRVKFYAL